MKKYVFIVLAFFILESCDKKMSYDYFIVNACDAEITVYIEVGRNNNTKNIIILPQETALIYSGTSINKLQNRLVEFFFNKMIINKGYDTSRLNYIDKNIWKWEPVSENHANSYLTIYPKDFE
jgi:hypothetical protein